MIQIYASRIQKEAEGKWKIAQESRANQNVLEKKLCVTEGACAMIYPFSQPQVITY